MMKIVHSCSLPEFAAIFDKDPENDPGGYIKDKFMDMRLNMFEYLCQLDTGNQRALFDFAAKKQIVYALKRNPR